MRRCVVDRLRSQNAAANDVAAWAAWTSLAACLGPPIALAQEGQSTSGEAASAVIDEVVVTGIRRSLTQSLDVKRDAANVVDVISAEDIGKFPDANVAESLQHITGVAITRERGGEGQFITVRGLGEEFNLVTVNNRVLATDNSGREFSFDVLPSEIISGAAVYKSPLASIIEGSIGATVNLTTARPFDNPGPHSTVTVGGEYNGLPDDLGPRVSGLVSNTFGDKVGALLSFSYTDREIRTDNLTNYIIEIDHDLNQDGALSDDETGLVIADSYYYGAYLERRKRIGASGALQFRPTDDIDITLDALYSHYSTPATTSSLIHVFGGSLSEQAYFEPGTVRVDANKTVTGFTINDINTEVATLAERRIVDTYQVGLNGKWQVSPSWQLSGDASWSRATRNEGGDSQFVVAGMKHGTVSFGARNGRVPEMTVLLEDGRTIGQATNDDFRIHYVGISGDDRDDEVVSGRLDAEFSPAFASLRSVQFGAEITDRSKSSKVIDNTDGQCAYCGHPFSFGEAGVDVIRPPLVSDLWSDQGGTFPRDFRSFSIANYFAAARAAENNPDIINPATGEPYPVGYSDQLAPVFNAAASSNVEERSTAAYVQANFAGERWSANIGGRLIRTDLTSSGASRSLLELIRIPGTPDSFPVFSDLTPVEESNDYSKFLPSANLTFNLRDDLLLRFAAAKVISRPSLSSLATATFVSTDLGARIVEHVGNPKLQPTMAKQADLSLEWYFGVSSGASAAVFYKDIEGFISTVTTQIELAGTEFADVRPVNGDAADVLGFELALQHFFRNGFGAQVNYTYAKSEASLDSVSSGVQTTLENLSKHSYNLTGIYENDRFSTRLSYNYRDHYVQAAIGRGQQPETVAPYKGLDFSLSYSLTEQLSLFAEAINLLEEERLVYSQYRNRVLNLERNGRRFSLGVRAVF
jgi:iron complex outermembrane recepter protein